GVTPTTKNSVVPYPHFTKLIIDYILTTHLDIPKRLNELHHLVAHDDVVQSIFASENYKRRDVPTTQPQLAVSSQGTHRTPSAPRSPNPRSTLKKKKESASGESSVAKIPLNYTLAKSTQEAEAQANFKLVEQHLMDEDLNMTVEGDDAIVNKFAASKLLSQEDYDTRIDPGSDKERPDAMKIDDYVASFEEEEESAQAVLIWKKEKSVMENMKKTFNHKDNVRTILEKVDHTLKEVVPKTETKTTDGIIKDNLPLIVVDAVKKEREQTKAYVPTPVSQAFATYAP
ncbi:hypothetical protein Tco_0264551, partial [Tanacetum coccineum]